MRRPMILTALAAGSLALAGTGVAAAEHGQEAVHHHRHGHRALAHRRHLRRVHVVHVVTPPNAAAPMPVPATTPPATPPPNGAATVASFANGVLTVTLADGTMLSGRVTEATRIRCELADRDE